MDKFREALINYMVSVGLCEGADFIGLDGIIDPLTKEETDEIIKEVDNRIKKDLQAEKK